MSSNNNRTGNSFQLKLASVLYLVMSCIFLLLFEFLSSSWNFFGFSGPEELCTVCSVTVILLVENLAENIVKNLDKIWQTISQVSCPYILSEWPVIVIIIYCSSTSSSNSRQLRRQHEGGPKTRGHVGGPLTRHANSCLLGPRGQAHWPDVFYFILLIFTCILFIFTC